MTVKPLSPEEKRMAAISSKAIASMLAKPPVNNGTQVTHWFGRKPTMPSLPTLPKAKRLW